MTTIVGPNEIVTLDIVIHSIQAYLFLSININGLVKKIAIVVQNGIVVLDLISIIFVAFLVQSIIIDSNFGINRWEIFLFVKKSRAKNVHCIMNKIK